MMLEGINCGVNSPICLCFLTKIGLFVSFQYLGKGYLRFIYSFSMYWRRIVKLPMAPFNLSDDTM